MMKVIYSNVRNTPDKMPRRQFDQFDVQAEKEGAAIRQANAFRPHRQSKRNGGAMMFRNAA
jgi:hypothetical protein